MRITACGSSKSKTQNEGISARNILKAARRMELLKRAAPEAIAEPAAPQDDLITDADVINYGKSAIKLYNYPMDFQLVRNGQPLDEMQARDAIVNAIISMQPFGPKIKRRMQEDVLDGLDFTLTVQFNRQRMAPSITYTSEGMRKPAMEIPPQIVQQQLASAGVTFTFPEQHRRNPRRIENPDAAVSKEERLEEIRETQPAEYLKHAKQCGFLVNHTVIRIAPPTGKQQGRRKAQVEVYVEGGPFFTTETLRNLIDASGNRVFASMQGYIRELADRSQKRGIAGSSMALAQAVLTFLGIDNQLSVDVNSFEIQSLTSERKIPLTKFANEVLRKLIGHRPDIPAAQIEGEFKKGQSGDSRW